MAAVALSLLALPASLAQQQHQAPYWVTTADFVGNTCLTAAQLFSSCSSTLGQEGLQNHCCTPFKVLKSLSCFCNPISASVAQDQLTAEALQGLLLCSSEEYADVTISCDGNGSDTPVAAWSTLMPKAVNSAQPETVELDIEVESSGLPMDAQQMRSALSSASATEPEALRQVQTAFQLIKQLESQTPAKLAVGQLPLTTGSAEASTDSLIDISIDIEDDGSMTTTSSSSSSSSNTLMTGSKVAATDSLINISIDIEDEGSMTTTSTSSSSSSNALVTATTTTTTSTSSDGSSIEVTIETDDGSSSALSSSTGSSSSAADMVLDVTVNMRADGQEDGTATVMVSQVDSSVDADSQGDTIQAEVDIDLGQDSTGGDVLAVLQHVNRWVSSLMTGGDPDAIDRMDRSGDLQSVLSRVGDLISGFAQDAAADAGADGLDVEITYDIDVEVEDGAAGIGNLGAATVALQKSLQGELQRIKGAVGLDSAASTASSVAADASVDFSRFSTELLGFEEAATTSAASDSSSRRHMCWKRALYNWLCSHRALVRAALIVEVVLIAVLAVVAVAWSFAGAQQQDQQQQMQRDDLTAPLIEDASRYADNNGVTVSPLWSHMISSKTDSYHYSRV